MTVHDAWRMDIASLGAAYARGVHDPVSIVQALMADIAADARGIHAFCHLDADAALAQARAASHRWQQGRALGPLDGVRVSIKDLIAVEGWPTRRGSLSSAGDPPATQDAPLVAHLRATGADIGIDFDGDGDRVLMVDADGTVRDGEHFWFLLERDDPR